MNDIELKAWAQLCGILVAYSVDNLSLTLQVYDDKYTIYFDKKKQGNILDILKISSIGKWVEILRTDNPENEYRIALE